MHLLHPPAHIRHLALLVARVAIGAIFLAHGLQKFSTNTMAGTIKAFEGMGVPAPALSAWFAASVETVGGAALILGALVPLFGLLLALNMAGALFIVHAGNGIFVDNGGYELVLALGVAALLFAASGSGRFGVDAWLAKRSSGRALTA